ncbi:MAG: beta-N-acetylhexosaminidase [Candidatus Cloacimonetes bacterium]|nr:beta-N-acetylhexosaminidase [Candidatus Cloacimonadota bacterium]MCF7813138.1 beta-N-acetylhexosaminidase [Candidatus Cloacimonadota bacterium]MCF7867586.1 beta-N-acetylhexosaminidase [Candidatus Cloacimonadota bacterium]MCF7883139.1 beta-N-acetylhexosaminidase [Candidatus Cloacimonadota bacterium]
MYNVIPKPARIKSRKGYFTLNSNTKIQIIPEAKKSAKLAEYLINQIYDLMGVKIGFLANSHNFISLETTNAGLGKEGYSLIISESKIEIMAEAENGIFYGIQTLLQLLPAEVWQNSKLKFPLQIPCCEIEDKPRFRWRGMHLDVSRHFFGIEFIKKYVDLLAMHKFNVFHWHLTDDNGWRIEIKKYPELTRTCAWRKNLEHLPWLERQNLKEEANGVYGGFYTQNEIKEIIQYAEDRFVCVVPEIEMPGHSSEVFAAFPQFSCREKKLQVAPGGYCTNPDLFCAGKNDTFDFLKDILKEVLELFPSRHIHIGGDEADKSYWKECSLCRQRMVNENLKNEDELQSWFMQQIARFIRRQKKIPVVWDEITDGGVNEEMLVMCWRKDGIDSARKALASGCKVVMCPNPYLYFDWKQNVDDKGAFGVTTLEKVYNYDPVPNGFSDDEAKYILGAQGNVWTEWMPSEQRVEYMALPRMSALAELIWIDPDKKDYSDFVKRLDKIFMILTNRGVNFNRNIGEI